MTLADSAGLCVRSGFAPLAPALYRTASFLALAAGLMAVPAAADDITVTDERTTPIQSSDIDGTGPGDITLEDGGSVIVDGGAAVVLDSSNTVTSSGEITSNGEIDAIAISVLTPMDGPLSAAITNSGILSAGPASGGSGNAGIRLRGEAGFLGDIVNEAAGAILVTGSGSFGIDAGVAVDGSIVNDGEIDIDGSGGFGIRTTAPVIGSIENAGEIDGRNADSTGISVGGAVSGSVLNLGTIVTGTVSSGTADQQPGGPGIRIGADVGGGILNGFIEEGEDGESPPGADAEIAARGGANAILITVDQAVAADTVIGAFGTGADAFGLINRASLSGSADRAGLDVTSLRIEGRQIGDTLYQSRLVGGFSNQGEGSLIAQAVDARATALSIGAGGIVPALVNDGTIASVTSASADGPGGSATGLLIEDGGALMRLVNSGTLSVVAAGSGRSAVAVEDRSGTLTDIDNSGIIAATLAGGASGVRTALDLAAATAGVTLLNEGRILGDVRLGSGDDRLELVGGRSFGTDNLPGGVVQGLIDFGGGTDTLTLRDGAIVDGTIASAGTLDLTVRDSTLRATSTDPIQVTNALFSDGAVLSIAVLGAEGAAGGIAASDSVTIEGGADLVLDFRSFPGVADTFTIVSAADLLIEGGLDALDLDLDLSSILFDPSLQLIEGERTELAVTLALREASDIGLNARQAAVFERAVPSLQQDDPLGGAIANLGTEAEVASAFEQLLPEVSEVSRLNAQFVQNQMLTAISQRFRSLRQLDATPQMVRTRAIERGARRYEPAEPGTFGLWLQEMGQQVSRDETADAEGFSGYLLGFAGGIDVAVLGLDAIGIGFTQTIGEFRDRIERDPQESGFEVVSTQINAYASLSAGGFYADLLGGVGFNNYENERFVDLGEVDRTARAEWDGMQYGGSLKTGYRLGLGRFGLGLAAVASYLELDEDAYAEEGDEAVAFSVEDRDTTSLRAGGMIELDAVFELGEESFIVPRLRGGLLHEFEDDPVTTTARFRANPDPFTVRSDLAYTDTIYGGAELSFMSEIATIALTYDFEYDDEVIGHTGSAIVRFRF